jgi:AraC-like DNA-binding protein
MAKTILKMMDKSTTSGYPNEIKTLAIPDLLKPGVGHFNIFPIQNINGQRFDCQPYTRRGFYKISLIKGHTRLHYADKILEFKNTALLFSNPYIPYSWEQMGEEQTGVFCLFSDEFTDQYSHIKDYPVFKPGGNPLYELDDAQEAAFGSIFEKMLYEIDTDFQYKYDLLRNLVMEVIYKALKMQPASEIPQDNSNAAVRVATVFAELLERQFPIESLQQRIRLRFPAEYAEHLSIHINYLNRTLKKLTGKTTSQLIAARIMQEARILLQHTDWNVSEIGWTLGFDELPHFINFFKKNEKLTPKYFRKGHSVS